MVVLSRSTTTTFIAPHFIQNGLHEVTSFLHDPNISTRSQHMQDGYDFILQVVLLETTVK